MFITTGTKSDYDKHIVAPNREWSAKFQYYYNGYWNSLEITSVQSFQLSDYSTDGSNISIGTVIGGKLDCKLMRISESVTSRLNRGTPIKISLTLNSSKATSSVTMASAVFVIDESKLTLRKSGGTYDISITAYDFSYTLTNKYIASSQSLSAIEILNEIGSKCGFTLGESVSSAISEFEDVSGGETKYTPLEDMTHKQTIGYMAGCYGCFAYFDNNLKLQFGWYESNGDTIKADRVFNGNSYIAEMEQRTIAMLETGTNSNPIVVPNNAKGFSINFENPYITQAQAEAVYNKRIADGKITFKIGKLSYKGSPLNNPRTIVTVKDVQNYGSPFYIMKRTLRYDGGLSETIECQGESEATINYKLTSPTQQRINRALSKMEEAIKNATDIITQTKGSVFEFIPIDETNPLLGNSGWKLYSTDIGKKNVILANSSGIGFSSNGGQSFNAAAIYIDENGVGHINANYIDVGEIDGSIIKAGTLVVGKNDIEGLDTELQALLDATNEADKKAGNAQTTANTAQTTANTASTNASNALSVANSANGKIASWASANDTTLIDGAKIYTGSITAKQIESGSITADKLAIGLNNTNYAATEDWEGDTDYLSFSFDSSNSYKPKISMTFSATSFEKRLKLNKSFYVTAGSKLYCSAIAYADGTSNASNTYVGIGLSYSSSLNGDYSLSQYASSHNLSLKTEHKIGFDTTVNQSGYYRIEVWFNKCNNKAYLKDIFVAQGVPGEIVVNGKISSVDGKTYFDLDNSTVITDDGQSYTTELFSGGVLCKYQDNVLGGFQPFAYDISKNTNGQSIWFNNALAIGEGQLPNMDTYATMINNEINFYKHLNFKTATVTDDAAHTKMLLQSGILYTYSDSDFAGFVHKREAFKITNASNNSMFIDWSKPVGKIKCGVGSTSGATTTYSFVYDDYKAPNLIRKTKNEITCDALTLSTSAMQYLTQNIGIYGAKQIIVEFTAIVYGWTNYYICFKKIDGSELTSQRVDLGQVTDTAYISKNITVPTDAASFCIGIIPDTAYSGYWAGWTNQNVRMVCITPTAALELTNSADEVVARLDCFTTSSSTIGLRTRTGSTYSNILEFGNGTLTYGTNPIVNSSSEKYKTEISLYTSNALDLINSSIIYSYKYKDSNEQPTGVTKYGLIIERECPKEVIDNSGDAISTYSMTSLAWKAIQELSDKVNELEEKLNDR